MKPSQTPSFTKKVDGNARKKCTFFAAGGPRSTLVLIVLCFALFASQTAARDSNAETNSWIKPFVQKTENIYKTTLRSEVWQKRDRERQSNKT